MQMLDQMNVDLEALIRNVFAKMQAEQRAATSAAAASEAITTSV